MVLSRAVARIREIGENLSWCERFCCRLHYQKSFSRTELRCVVWSMSGCFVTNAAFRLRLGWRSNSSKCQLNLFTEEASRVISFHMKAQKQLSCHKLFQTYERVQDHLLTRVVGRHAHKLWGHKEQNICHQWKHYEHCCCRNLFIAVMSGEARAHICKLSSSGSMTITEFRTSGR